MSSARWMAVVFATALGVLAPAVDPARAGEYPVYACSAAYGDVNQSWTVTAYTDALQAFACSHGVGWDRGLVTTLRPRQGFVPFNTAATYTFRAPAGTTLTHMQYDFSFCGGNWFFAGLWVPGGPTNWTLAGCSTLPSPQDMPLYNATQVNLSTKCGTNYCSLYTSSQIHATMANVRVWVNDPTPPSVTLAGGTIKTSAWQRGSRTLVANLGDATGIYRLDALLDQTRVANENGQCDYTRSVPCVGAIGAMDINTRVVPDGRRQLRLVATDAAANSNVWTGFVNVDNTAPGSPVDPRLEGGSGWRASNDFTVSWLNPAQPGVAPIAALRAAICPASVPSDSWKGCTTGALRSPNVTRLTHYKVPTVGEWQLRLWLEDAAGNQDSSTARTVQLRWDNIPPSARIAEVDAMDPQRVTVATSDVGSGVVRADIEIKRQGTDAWIALPTTRTTLGFTTIVDDSALPDGVYDLRTRVVDAAGNERTITTRASGAAARLSLPLRLPTKIAAGGVRTLRGRHGKRREILVKTATASFGKRVVVKGRLTSADGNPLSNTDIDALERTSLPDQPWVRVGIVRTGLDGRFVYVARRGPNRAIQFRYAGTALIRPQIATVNLRVRAKTTIDVNRRAVVNGDDVVFHGRVGGGPMPATGKLLQLQAYSRGTWRTFATPRAGARSHRWRYDYRFTATRGTVRYRFRAVVPQEGGFPYVRGSSRSLKVVVRGL